jgi:hypothetical protein
MPYYVCYLIAVIVGLPLLAWAMVWIFTRKKIETVDVRELRTKDGIRLDARIELTFPWVSLKIPFSSLLLVPGHVEQNVREKVEKMTCYDLFSKGKIKILENNVIEEISEDWPGNVAPFSVKFTHVMPIKESLQARWKYPAEED